MNNTRRLNSKWRLNSKLSKLFIKCRTMKCSKQIRDCKRKDKQVGKVIKARCPDLPINSHIKCTIKILEKTKAKKVCDKIVKCSHIKCQKEREELNKLRKNPIFKV